MVAVKACQAANTPKAERKQIAPTAIVEKTTETESVEKNAETINVTKNAETKDLEVPSRLSDQSDSDSSSDGCSTLHTYIMSTRHYLLVPFLVSIGRSTPSPSKYPNAGRRETGVAASLIPTNFDDDNEDETACTSFNGPYADSDDDIGNVNNYQ